MRSGLLSIKKKKMKFEYHANSDKIIGRLRPGLFSNIITESSGIVLVCPKPQVKLVLLFFILVSFVA